VQGVPFDEGDVVDVDAWEFIITDHAVHKLVRRQRLYVRKVIIINLVFRIQPPDEFLDLLFGRGHFRDIDKGVESRYDFEMRDYNISGETEHVVTESSLFSLHCWSLGEVIVDFTGCFSLGLTFLEVFGRSLYFNMNVLFF
jgi:hypothetical protein